MDDRSSDQGYRPMISYPNLPRKGDKVVFRRTGPFWYTSYIENADKHLRPGQIYTVESISISSSWCGVKLKETGDMEFVVSWFDYAHGSKRTT